MLLIESALDQCLLFFVSVGVQFICHASQLNNNLSDQSFITKYMHVVFCFASIYFSMVGYAVKNE